MPYAINLFAGSKLFGKELLLRNRNANRNRDPPQQFNQHTPSLSLSRGYGGAAASMFMGSDTGQLIQQQLLQLATGQSSNLQNYADVGAQMFTGNPSSYASTRSDTAGSHRDREHFGVDRSRYHREENRSNRSKPYRRSRSRSPQQTSYRSRDKSPQDQSRNRGGRRSDEKSGQYHRWGKR